MARLKRDMKRERMWRRHIAAQPGSGQTIRVYCETHGLRETSFYFWRTEIAKRDREAATEPMPAPAFVPVAVIDPPAIRTEASIEIRLVDGHRVRVRSGCDRALLADVIRLLRNAEGRPC